MLKKWKAMPWNWSMELRLNNCNFSSLLLSMFHSSSITFPSTWSLFKMLLNIWLKFRMIWSIGYYGNKYKIIENFFFSLFSKGHIFSYAFKGHYFLINIFFCKFRLTLYMKGRQVWNQEGDYNIEGVSVYSTKLHANMS